MRKNDPRDLKKKFFRTNDRFFQINGQWYFSAREGDIGPFRSREQARLEARAYVVARQAAEGMAPGQRRMSDTTVIPGYVYRSVLSMEQQVSHERAMVLDLEDPR